jgi:DNA-binding NtrC family response regulator
METQNLRILLVDDDLFLLSMLTQQFKAEGIENILTATSEKECFEVINECDIVILDYFLNNENGIEILRKIKAKYPELPVIFLSGQEYVNVAIRSLKYGAFDYLEKSKLNFNRIMEIIQSAVDYQNSIQKNSKLSKIKRLLSFGLL